MKSCNIEIRLEGVRPLMMDRYAGDNNTQLPLMEKVYLDKDGHLIVPAINLYSLLCSENTKSVARTLLGKSGKTIAMGISSYTNIEPFEIPLLGEGDKPLTMDAWGKQITEHRAVARLKAGVPNPKIRPKIDLPWALEFTMSYEENSYCSLENLRMAIDRGSIIGLGTFRPFFGRYTLEKFDIR